jgi:hypothetical protein
MEIALLLAFFQTSLAPFAQQWMQGSVCGGGQA